MNSFILVQIFGVMTLILFVITLQQPKKETFLLLQTVGTLLFIVLYILTNRITVAVIFTIVAIRGLVFLYYFNVYGNINGDLQLDINFNCHMALRFSR